VLGMFLNGDTMVIPGPHGERIVDDSFVLLFNAHEQSRTFTLPHSLVGSRWSLELSTADPDAEPGSATYGARAEIDVLDRAIVILRRID
ncbi:MAG: glycogen debranching enzyme, partial [Solirubrobacteraceae bacterium]